MAKLTLNKLGVTKNTKVIKVPYNGETIELKSYLPLNEKIELIQRIVNKSLDDNGYANPIRKRMWFVLETVETYSNISFTAKQKENPQALYDLLVGTELFDLLLEACPDELYKVSGSVDELILEFYRYRDSALGILQAATQDYGEVNLAVDDLTEKLNAAKQTGELDLIKEVVTKLD